MTTSEVSKTEPVYDDETLAGIRSFEDALAVLSDAGVVATDIKEYGDGFEVMDKAAFVNVPFVILDYKFAKGDYDAEFVIFRIVAKDGRKAILTDGGTGICAKFQEFAKRNVVGGVICPKGLTVSEYDYVNKSTGEATPAKTYYLSQ